MMLENEVFWRLSFFIGILCAVAIGEAMFPRRERHISRGTRWSRNLFLVLFNSLIVRLIVPFTAVGVAFYAGQNGYGLFNQLSLPVEIAVVLGILLLDLLIYLQHVVFHHVPILWRLHKIHHIDQEIDVTTGLRFHPVEIILSTLIKCGAVFLLGVPVLAVVVFEILLNATAMFNHGNIKLPLSLDRILRFLVVTPDMHRVHHSVIMRETNSNFGFNVPWWDRLFGTYRSQPERGHDRMEIGLEDYRESKKTGLWVLLTLPFFSKNS